MWFVNLCVAGALCVVCIVVVVVCLGGAWPSSRFFFSSGCGRRTDEEPKGDMFCVCVHDRRKERTIKERERKHKSRHASRREAGC